VTSPTSRFTRRLTLERLAAAPDGGGGGSPLWTAAGLHWAELTVEAATGAEAEGVETSRVRLAARLWAAPHGTAARPVAGDRFREGARLYRVLAVTEDRDARFLICRVEEEGAR
jgi:head-tail adaptor